MPPNLKKPSPKENKLYINLLNRSKSFLLRQPFQRKQLSFPASRQNRRKGFEPSSLDEEQENNNNNSSSTATLNRKTSAQVFHQVYSE